MSSGTAINSARKSGQRKESRHGGKSLLAPTLGVHTSDLGEHRLNIQQIYALEAMYCTHPAVQAARSVLHSQLLQGGIQLMRNGEVAKPVRFGETNDDGSRKTGITQDWARHLDEHWLPFAKEVIDAFLKWGLCPVVLEEAPDKNDQLSAIEQLKREVGVVDGKRKELRKRDRPKVLVPHVPMLGTYDIAWAYSGRYGYTREYMLYNNAPGHVTRIDQTAVIHIRQHPDSVGNVNSPLATVYEQGSFVAGLVEMAFTAELARSQPAYVTQIRKPEKNQDLSAGGLFFDSESRQQQNGQESEESALAARALELQSQLARAINQAQHRGESSGSSSAAPRFGPAEQPPKLFTLPKDQELAPHVQVPQPRGDLESLMRLGIDQFCSALGVPASLLFEGRFSNNSSATLQLLNSTISQLAKAVSQVLTKTYNMLYADDDETDEEPAQLKLITAPLSVAEEIEKLYTAQLIDYETALPAALHSLGATTEEIEAAMKRAKEKDDKKCQCEDEDRALNKQDAEQSLSDRQQQTQINGDKAKLDIEQQKAQIAQTKKQTDEIGKPKPAASGSGGGGGSSSSS